MTATHVRVFYPADPLGIVPGGIDTFLRGLFKWAPPDLEFSLVGMTTDPQRRPQGCWTRCSIGQREFDFFPVVTVGNAGGRGRIPLSLRFSFGIQRYRGAISHGFDVFDFHRPEPSLLFTADQRPKNAYFHNDPETIRSSQSDNLWRRLPGIYESIERYTFEKFDSAWCVRDSGVQTLRQRYPAQASRINFIPTWVDADVFNGIDDQARENLRSELAKAHRLDLDSQWIISVGRLDTQKDPFLTLAAFARLRAEKRRVEWLVVGDGVLRSELEHAAVAAGLGGGVHFLGLRSPAQIADLLRSADVYALSSAYEGMPMALLEALGCGLPAAVTDVGEVRRVLQHGVNGTIATARDEVAFAWALSRVLDNAGSWRGSPARAAVETYQPEKVLAVAYENYRRLGAAHARIRNTAETARSANFSRGANGLVVGLPVDVLDRASACARITALFSNTVFLGLSAVKALCSLAERSPLFRRLSPPLFSDGQLMTMNATLDVRAIEELVTRVDARLTGSGGRMIGFVASGSGEGTTTLALGYASAVLARLQRRVLVLGVAKVGSGLPGVLPTLAKGLPLDECLQAFPGGGFCGSLGGGGPDEALWELLVRADLWADLRNRFDSIVLDLPATSVSRIGLVCATQCDGVVVVLEAEKTRAPVVENLINSLRAVGANMLGTVFNKRRYYLPQRIYRWL